MTPQQARYPNEVPSISAANDSRDVRPQRQIPSDEKSPQRGARSGTVPASFSCVYLRARRRSGSGPGHLERRRRKARAAVALNVLVFQIGGVRYAFHATDVREIVRAVNIVPLPQAPSVIEGVINVRGTVVPMLDLRRRFHLPAKPLALTDHFILAMAGPRLVCVRADSVLDLCTLNEEEIEAADTLPGARHLSGVAKTADGPVLIHDLRGFLEDAEAAALDDAVAVVDQASAP
jgi:purine-binding chemotaxis protein CheW